MVFLIRSGFMVTMVSTLRDYICSFPRPYLFLIKLFLVSPSERTSIVLNYILQSFIIILIHLRHVPICVNIYVVLAFGLGVYLPYTFSRRPVGGRHTGIRSVNWRDTKEVRDSSFTSIFMMEGVLITLLNYQLGPLHTLVLVLDSSDR